MEIEFLKPGTTHTPQEIMLAMIKHRMATSPKFGNFYIWYYHVFQQYRKDPSGKAQAIQNKYDELGLQNLHPMNILESKDEPKQ